LLAADFKDLKEDKAEENLQARIRAALLMAYSNKFDRMLLNTGNKSEASVGYCTLYGDMAGGFAPIKDLPKALVIELSRYYNGKQGREVIPASVIERPPTAELRENQRDTDSLPPYDVLDRMLQMHIEKNMDSGRMIRSGLDPVRVKEVLRMVRTSEYKRRQAPPGAKITPLALGKDRRMPVTNRFKG
jgi:NAD+ synthase (glutamine-hydrolysing)